MRLRVGLVSADKSKMPNLVLMKLSAWHKAQGDEVFFRNLQPPVDRLYISCIYRENAAKARGIEKLFPTSEVIFGGYGINGTMLPPAVEHTCPDYKLYPDTDFAMGYTSRGCPRSCPWCVIPQREGMCREWSPFEEFWDGQEKMVLLDPNFLASSERIRKLEWLIDHNIRVNFNQGLDIRLVTDRIAQLLARVRSANWHFTDKYFHFAFDDSNYEAEMRRGVERLVAAGISPRNLMFYMLCGYKNSTFGEEMHRFRVLRELGVDPYVMLYEKKRGTDRYHFARWVNARIYKVCEWKDYSRRRT